MSKPTVAQNMAHLRTLIHIAQENGLNNISLSIELLASLLNERTDLLARYEALMEGLGLDPSPECFDEYTPARLRGEAYGIRGSEEMLAEQRALLLSTIKLIDSYFKLIDDDALPIDDKWIALAAHEAKQSTHAALAMVSEKAVHS
jgi:hypothetical protein